MTEEKEKVEIDLLELARKLWDKKRFILKFSLIGLIIGIIIAFSTPKEYTTTIIFTSESKSMGNMGELASMAGINLGGRSGEELLSPELYPNILNSTLFVQKLLDIKVADSNQNIDSTTLYNYIKEDQTIAWWKYIVKAPQALLSVFSSNDTHESESSITNKYYISKEDMLIIEALRSSCLVNTNKKSGVTTLEVTAQSPVISAFVTDKLASYLQSYIIENRTRKARTNLENTERLYAKAKADYYKAQESLASFVDGNRNVTSARYLINQEKLQNEANIAYSVYNQMAQQVQTNKIKVQDETPIFTIIQPAIEPIYPEKPKKIIIIIGLTFLGFACACGWIGGKMFYKKYWMHG